MGPEAEFRRLVTRRELLGRASQGIGAVALASLLAQDGMTASSGHDRPPGILGVPHGVPRAKRVIYILHNGAPSQVDLFDHKPGLKEMRGEPLPESVRQGQRLTHDDGKPETALPVAGDRSLPSTRRLWHVAE